MANAGVRTRPAVAIHRTRRRKCRTREARLTTSEKFTGCAPAGTGKSSLAANFASAACARGEDCLYFAFEESPSQIIRNMRSVGIDVERWVKRALIAFPRDAANQRQDWKDIWPLFTKWLPSFDPAS